MKPDDPTIEIMKGIRAEPKATNGRVDALAGEMDARFEEVSRRFDDVTRRSDVLGVPRPSPTTGDPASLAEAVAG